MCAGGPSARWELPCAHGMTAVEYREEFGLLRTRALSARSLSREQSRTRLTGYRASKKAQARFAASRAIAHSRELTRSRRVTTTERTVPEELERRPPHPGQGRGRPYDGHTARRRIH